MHEPYRIEPEFVERVWGRTDLAPLYPPSDRKIGEVWFRAGERFPVLVKFIFTEERLSVQVHPNDEYARAHENSRGKTEMWHILDAKPGATIALSFREPLTAEELRAAIADGSIERRLNHIPVKAGDTLFAPAGAVHAIGAGIVLCEIQQDSDVTYRLYDYGRPREVHLEKGLAVADTGVYDGRRNFPVVCDHFTTELLEVEGPGVSDARCDHLLIAIAGAGRIGASPVKAGETWYVPAEAAPVALAPEPRLRLLRTRCGAAR